MKGSPPASCIKGGRMRRWRSVSRKRRELLWRNCLVNTPIQSCFQFESLAPKPRLCPEYQSFDCHYEEAAFASCACDFADFFVTGCRTTARLHKGWKEEPRSRRPRACAIPD